ncbi:hypothetical protein [Nostoc sp.]|uniref:hypothetical protein n=1 Tax=Nostoc sp. TaxID=1180 RepID=UPI002FF27174
MSGYAVHLTETCDEDLPCLITNVETTPATTFDGDLKSFAIDWQAQSCTCPAGNTNVEVFSITREGHRNK